METSFAVMTRLPPLRLLLLLLTVHSHLTVWAAMDSCYDEEGRPSRCMPRFENVAFNRTAVASNVCGSPPEDYCMQTGSTRSCHTCDASDPERSHNASLLTDFNRNEEATWWQSQSMFYGIQHPNSVNLTLHLGKAFEITYIRLKFYTSRPESFAVFKRTREDEPWQPYQYYSASCTKTYGKEAKGYIRPGDDERKAVCTDEFSDISPLTGGNVAFSTLEGRPSAYNFDRSPTLQEWVTATDLLISFDRLNTFGDEFFKDSKVLRSYFYAISDFSVGGRCKCNGHASECVEGEHGALVCACQHDTVGADCQRCHPFYQDRPWARATGDSANECLKCNCSGRSDECVFDTEQYRRTGSGGRCMSCRDNTDGPHCESCRENHHRTSAREPCLPCNCNINGSRSLQCDEDGRCACRDGVTGEKCDMCQNGFFAIGPWGCRPCDCDRGGSVADCSPLDGRCYCKPNVEARSCDRCRPGFFNLQAENPAGCQPCFCFGHSLVCTSSDHYAAVNITSHFVEDQEGWLGEFSGGLEFPLQWKEGEVYLLPLSPEDVGFYKAPEKFLGHRVHSYGQPLTVTFTSETPELLPDHVTLLLQASGTTLSADLTSRPALRGDPGNAPRRSFVVSSGWRNQLIWFLCLTCTAARGQRTPFSVSPQENFSTDLITLFRLHEIEGRFKPSLSASEFQHLLHNLTALKISNAGGHNYTSQLAGVTLTSASPYTSTSTSSGPAAPWVEACSCPPGFTGQFCESCIAGFTREDPSRGLLSPCVPCNCHQHGSCHPETGVCECSHFTTGLTCEHCLDGYHGNAVIGTPGDCQPCPCPGRTSCARIAETGQVVCTNCPAGQTGVRCQTCEDGYYGDPLGESGPARPCARCECNGNVDVNAVGVCDRVTGRCLKCLGHTEGDGCQRCQRGYYGDALDRTASRRCKPCSCDPAGTSGREKECDPRTGSCRCLSHVTGRDCSYCEVGFFNLQPGVGCETCKCNPIGSSSMACHPITGQCVCRAGVEGRLCDSCRAGFFGFSSRGCRACNCDPMGSVSMQCHANGTCPCRQGFVGYKCDKCELNYFHDRETHQCEECPTCYSLVKKQADKLRTRLQDLETLLARFDCRGRFGKHPHLLTYHMTRLQEQEGQEGQEEQQPPQREDALPNALEDFLAFQEAREAFIKQFSLLEASTGTLSAQLHDITSALNCSISAIQEEEEEEVEEEEEEERKESRKDERSRGTCQTFTETLRVITASQKQLHQATLDLDNMIIPFQLVSGPNKWSTMVNDSQALMKSHVEAADYMEAVAARALAVSERTSGLLTELLQDNSTEEYIRNLTKQVAAMQQQKQHLAAQLNDTAAQQAALGEENVALRLALENITSSLHRLPPPKSNQTRPSNHTTTPWSDDLVRQTQELNKEVQAKDDRIEKTKEEMKPLIQTADEKLKKMEDNDKLHARAAGAKVAALSSVVTAKEAESGAIALHRQLENMEAEWPRRQAQTRAAMRKERPLEGKVLADVRKKVAQIEQMIRPALEKSSASRNVSKEAERTANAVAKESKAVLTQAKHTRTASAHLGSHVDSALQQVSAQELLTDTANSRLASGDDVSLTAMKRDMEAAQLRLEAFSTTLTELVTKIDGNVPLERFDRILNETARRLSVLRGSVESPTLGTKIHRLQSAAKEQQSRLSAIEQDIQDITEERDSLRDIASNLPRSCPQAGRG